MPSFAARPCSRIAIRLDSRMTLSSVYPKRAPPARSVAQLPGSIYPTATRYPGPANASAFFHHAPRLTGTVRYTSARLGVSRGCRQPVSKTLFAIGGAAGQQQSELPARDARRAPAPPPDRGAVERLPPDHPQADPPPPPPF